MVFYSTVKGLFLSQITVFYFTAGVAAFYSTVGVTAFYSTVEVTAFYCPFHRCEDISTIFGRPHRRWLPGLVGASPFCNPLPVRPRVALVGLHCLNDVDLLGMLPSSASIVTLAYLTMTSAAWACRCQLQRSPAHKRWQGSGPSSVASLCLFSLAVKSTWVARDSTGVQMGSAAAPWGVESYLLTWASHDCTSASSASAGSTTAIPGGGGGNHSLSAVISFTLPF
ncbi:hypothetical protein Taro_043905 [Colocasia esculenta]|uniref:Uncharacterized protein n=1 Tax=Colocasia esculenta TaxID=4460 RepID=A0A843WSK5_COLES|nr:hypothetical protein [Colocasia esculenta]